MRHFVSRSRNKRGQRPVPRFLRISRVVVEVAATFHPFINDDNFRSCVTGSVKFTDISRVYSHLRTIIIHASLWLACKGRLFKGGDTAKEIQRRKFLSRVAQWRGRRCSGTVVRAHSSHYWSRKRCVAASSAIPWKNRKRSSLFSVAGKRVSLKKSVAAKREKHRHEQERDFGVVKLFETPRLCPTLKKSLLLCGMPATRRSRRETLEYQTLDALGARNF